MKNTTTKFFEHVSAIPKQIRDKYLLNLEIKNNHLANTKYNIAKEIFKIVESRRFDKWDEIKLKKKYNFTDGAFRFNKSIILKEIRELIFSGQNADSSQGKDLATKYKMYADYFVTGNMERHRNEFLSFEKELRENNIKNSYSVILSDVQRMLMIYYFHKRNYLRFNYFYGSISKIYNRNKTNSILKKKDIISIRINYLWAEYYKQSFNWINNKDLIKSEEYIAEIYREARKYKISIHHLSTIIIRMWLSRSRNDLVKMVRLAEEGYKLSIEYNEEHISYLFKAYMYFGDVLNNKIAEGKCVELIGELYEKVKKHSPYSNVAKYLLDIYKQLMLSINEEKGLLLLKESSELCLVAGHTYDGLYNKFIYHFYNTQNKIIEYEKITDGKSDTGFISIKSINNDLISEFEENIKQLLNFNKNIFTVKFLSDIYLTQGMIDVFKGKSVDLKTAILTQERNDRLRKTRHFISNDWYFMTIRTYFRLISCTDGSKKDKLKKEDYIRQLIKQTEYFYGEPNEIGKLEFNILLYISQMINSKTLTNAVNKLYLWILAEKKQIFGSNI